jgi:NDP-sugar pyrophosphorylase family protein
LVNGGIYVLNPGLLSRIPKNTYFDMTTFFDELISGGERVGAFPFYEYWIDIGRLDDFEKAHKDFIEVFKPKM